ncbi:uncharacterized protein LOC110855951 isoform X2 [Folsomia candida]|uniref:uncharacterized protein LOC110855951 isoform X2 n=1 Tax=Folsomia candida TaxID=158441 RepID=UPI000B8FB638|nr:uncharacterized protein LOC110855951 isoform X2 [Folsomia candida]
MSLVDSEYSLHENNCRPRGMMGKRANLLSLGLPLGSGLVLIALLNTIFTAHSVLNLVEIVTLTGSFIVKSHLLPVLMVGFLFILTTYLWIAVIFTGRSYHVSIWIAGSLLLLILKIVISSWTLLVSLSLRDALYWRKLWVLGVDIGMEVYIISIAVIAANVLWRLDDNDREMISQTPQNYSPYEASDADLSFAPEQAFLPLPPVGLKPKAFAQFYATPSNIELGTRVLLLLDIIYSIYILTTEKIPQVLLTNDRGDTTTHDYDEINEGGMSNLSNFGESRVLLIFVEDTVIRLGRVVTGVLIASLLMKMNLRSKRYLGYALFAQLCLISFSMLNYFALFGLFEQLSVSDRFYQVKMTFEILLRLGLVGFLVKTVERRRLALEGIV